VITLLDVRPYTGDLVAPSPNRGARREPVIRGIVLHATGDGGDEARTLQWMRSPRSRLSCHLFVSRTGEVTRLVGDQQRAWHATHARWRGGRDVNSCTLGIEIANRNDGEPFTDAQYMRVADIVAHYCRQGLALDDVVSHAEVAPRRCTDPCGWNWDRLRVMVQHRLQPLDAPTPSATCSAPVAPVVQRAPAKKSAAKRRAFWVNALTVLATAVVLLQDSLDLAFSVGLTLPDEITRWLLVGIGMVNIMLRYQAARRLARMDGAAPPAIALPAPRKGRGLLRGWRA
jgi:hypothetical protein